MTTARNRPAAPVAMVNLPVSETEREEIERAARIAGESPDIREHIASLRERIEAGTYAVTGEQIAEMILRRQMADRIR